MSFHLYADDTQLYLAFDNADTVSKESTLTQMELRIEEIHCWMHWNMLNSMVIKPSFFIFHLIENNCSDIVEATRIGTDAILISSEARNLGVFFDPDFTLNSHIMAICKVVNIQLYCIRHIKKILDPWCPITAIHSLVASKIDYCNSLLSGLPKYQTDSLQHLLNSAARIISGTRKHDHITPVLRMLHWLLVELGIKFNLI